jgi:penicillin-binding protein 2
MALTQHSPIPRQLNNLPSGRTVGRKFQSLAVMIAISVLMIGGLVSRLAYLQLFQGQQNRQLAESNRIRLIPRQPERGNILDRKGRILAGNRLSHSLFLWPIANKPEEWQAIAPRIAKILNVPTAQIQTRLEQAGYNSPELIRIRRSLSPAHVTALAEFDQEIKGVHVQAETVREYPYGDLAAHVLGYTGELDGDEYKDLADRGYRLGDVIGRMGIEAAFESQLRGEWGGQQVEVDSAGKVLQVLGEKEAPPGQTLQLTLDLDLQRAAERALGDRTGSIVALDPRNGAVLAMASYPKFDPNMFSKPIPESQWQRLEQSTALLNRTLQVYPPASTFKIVTTSAGIESGKFSPDTVLNTFPSLTIGDTTFGEWNHAGFGPLDFRGAMANSSDTFFYQIAQGIGEQPLIQWTRKYGFGKKTGIELAVEDHAGLVPDEAWKQREIGKGWVLGDTVNMSIGQGYLLASPLQVAVMFGVPANGGDRVRPRLLLTSQTAKPQRESVNLSPETLKILQDGLRQVVTSGTGEAMNVANLPPVSGKTGTAEDPPRPSHTWFGAYAPAENPEIVVVAFGENSGGGGGSLMAPIARQVLDAYFNGAKAKEQAKPVEVQGD